MQPQFAYDDLRSCIDQVRKLGEIKDVEGATWEEDLGMATDDVMIVVDTMRRRKQLMESRGDGFLMLPGGIGTYEEFFEILVGRQLREHGKPIGIVNSRGYFNPLVTMIEHGIEHRFIKPAIYELFRIDPEPVTVIDWLADPPDVSIEDDRILPMGRRQ